MDELEEKAERVRAVLAERGWRGILLEQRRNVAWITGGMDPGVVRSAETGAAAVLVPAQGPVRLLVPSLEAGRFRAEAPQGLAAQMVEYPWYDPAAKEQAVERVLGGKAPSDRDREVEEAVRGIRVRLSPVEHARLRRLGRDAAAAMAEAAWAVEPGWSERRCAVALAAAVRRRLAEPVVLLVGADDRPRWAKHPVPTDREVRSRVMLVLVAERDGLHVALTRIVAFEADAVNEEFQAEWNVARAVEAALWRGTRAGRTLGEILADAQAAYASSGRPLAWQEHHQGGIIGYLPREWLAVPGSAVRAEIGMAFAWNPSLGAAKLEDTFLLQEDGPEVVTGIAGWPTHAGRPQALLR